MARPSANTAVLAVPAPSFRRIDVHHALRIGLADHAAEESTSEDVALKVAREIALVSSQHLAPVGLMLGQGRRAPPIRRPAAGLLHPTSATVVLPPVC